jgi:hypothetical protein
MRRREREQILKESGFVYEREANHGAFWSDGQTRILCARSDSQDHRAKKNFLAEIKRAIEKREPMQMSTEIEKKRIIINPPREFHAKLGDIARIVPKPEPKAPAPAPVPERPKLDREVYKKRFAGHAPDARELIEYTVLELWEQDLTHAEIAKGLNDKGLKTIDGTKFTPTNVGYWVKRLGLQRANAALEAAPPPPEPVKVAPAPAPAPAAKPNPPPKETAGRALSAEETEFVLDVLKSGVMTPERKIKMILTYLEE